MRSKLVSSAVLALALSTGTGQAERLGGPAELPPAGFTGQQFVDSRGCLFMRAGLAGTVTWVPRVDANHKQICGYPPTFAAATLNAVAAAMQPDPEAAPAPPAAAPQPLRLVTLAKPPKGYKLAWKDDRLNPMRGIGTPEGQAQQDLLWTREVPARLVADKAKAGQPQRVTLSTMSAPAARTSVSDQASDAIGSLVQVGTFGEPANAARAAALLQRLALPVLLSEITRKGRVLTVVQAGPFASAKAARAALRAVVAAGFQDAVLRMD